MKKFKFKLQTLLDLREAREKEIKNELAALLSIQNIERMKQEEYRRKIASEREKFARTMREGRFSYAESMMFERFVEFGHRVIEVAQQKINGMEEEISKVRERLVEASREKKVVDKLRERKLREYQYELNREAAKETDEANQKLYVRRLIENAG